MDWPSIYTLSVIIILIALLIQGRVRPVHLFVSTMPLLLIPGIISVNDIVAGFTSPAVLTVGALFVVAGGVRMAGLLDYLDRIIHSRSGGMRSLMVRIMGPTSALSSLVNNTPIVAILSPQLQKYSGQSGIPISKMLIPLSYAAIIGGTITLFGTSTNLIVSEMLADRGHASFHFLQLAWIGIPASLIVLLWFVWIGHRWLPDRSAGPSPKASGRLAADPGLHRETRAATAQGRRGFGIPSGVYVLPGGHGMLPAPGYSLAVEAGASPSGVYAGMAHSGRPHPEATLAAGNVPVAAMLSAVPSGATQPGNAPPSSLKKTWTILVVAGMIGAAISGLLPVQIPVMAAAVLLIVTGVLPASRILESIHFSILAVIGAALAIGSALESTGLAEKAALYLVSQSSALGVIAVIAAIYLATNVLTELVTNNAAAVLMLPIALQTSVGMGLDPHAAGITVAVAASASFLTPIGYQTNLMVMEPGGYRYTDYLKAGLPVTLILMAITVTVVTWLWT